MKLRSSIEISRLPETVFAWISSPTKAREWQKNVKQERLVADKPGMVGTTFVETIEEDGNELQINGVVTRYELGHLIAFHLVSKIHELDVSYSLQALGQITQVTVEADIRWKFPMNVVSLVAGNSMQRRMESQTSDELRELKRICEGA